MANGKGSKPRPTDLKKYGANYDDINWRNKRQKMFGVEVKEGEFTCQACHGSGKDDPLDVCFADRPNCTVCKGTGQVTYATFKSQLGLP